MGHQIKQTLMQILQGQWAIVDLPLKEDVLGSVLAPQSTEVVDLCIVYQGNSYYWAMLACPVQSLISHPGIVEFWLPDDSLENGVTFHQ